VFVSLPCCNRLDPWRRSILLYRPRLLVAATYLACVILHPIDDASGSSFLTLVVRFLFPISDMANNDPDTTNAAHIDKIPPDPSNPASATLSLINQASQPTIHARVNDNDESPMDPPPHTTTLHPNS
jgi:hypothetical protein